MKAPPPASQGPSHTDTHTHTRRPHYHVTVTPLRLTRWFVMTTLCLFIYHIHISDASIFQGLLSSSPSSSSSSSPSPPPMVKERGGASKGHTHTHRHRQQEKHEGEGGGGGPRLKLRFGSILLPAPSQTKEFVHRHVQKLTRRFMHVFHKEINAFVEADPREENLVELLRTIPELVQEGHQETVDHLRRGWAALQQKALESLFFAQQQRQEEEGNDGGEGAEGKVVGGSAGGGMFAQAALRSHASQVDHHASQWVAKNSQEHLNQAQQYLTFLSENAPRALDVSSQLDLVERLLVTLRSATDGGLMPGADGQKKTMTQSQLKLVSVVQPHVMRLLDGLEKELGKTQHRKHPRLHLCIAEALGFNLGTARGLSAASCLGQVKRMSQSIEVALKHAPSLDSGMPHLIRGMFHLNCPPPLKSITKAKTCFLEALKVNPRSGRNLYFCGLACFLQHDYKEAQTYYTQAAALLPSEVKKDAQYAYLEVEVKRGMEMVKEKLQEDTNQEGEEGEVGVEVEGGKWNLFWGLGRGRVV